MGWMVEKPRSVAFTFKVGQASVEYSKADVLPDLLSVLQIIAQVKYETGRYYKLKMRGNSL